MTRCSLERVFVQIISIMDLVVNQEFHLLLKDTSQAADDVPRVQV